MSLIETAIAAARAAGRLQRERPRGALVVEDKGAADITTDLDRACEQAVVDMLRARHPDHAILAEEGTDAGKGAAVLWVVDPLDGTKNYAHGYPRSCVSIAALERGVTVCGVVLNPFAGELFAAERGGGATMNGGSIRVSATEPLSRAMVASALTYDGSDPTRRRADRVQLERLARVLAAAEAVRSDGCCALDLCDVACGRFDAYFEAGLKAWDTAAGALIVREAGGRTSDFGGGPHDPFGVETMASNALVHDALAEVLRL